MYFVDRIQCVDNFIFEEGSYVYAKMHKDGRCIVKAPELAMVYRDAVRVKVTGRRDAAK